MPRKSKNSFSFNRKVAAIAKKAVSRSKEAKLICTDWSGGFALTTSATTSTLYNVGQGNGSTSRDGNQVDPTKLRIRYCAEVAAGAPARIRVMVIQWNKGVDSVELPTNYLSCIPTDSKTQYRVLYDVIHSVNSTDATTLGLGPFKDISLYGSRLHRMFWNDSTTSSTAPDEGGKVQLLVYSSAVSGSKFYCDIQQFFKEV